MNALAHNVAFWVALIFGLIALYVLPSLIGAIRGVESLGWLIVINLLPSGVGWPAALMLALGLPRRQHLQRIHSGLAYGQAPSNFPSRATLQAAAEVLDLMLQADNRRPKRS
jgi:hypothetical protein